MIMITMVGKNSKSHELPGVDAMPARINGTIFIESTTKTELKRLADKYHLDYGNLCDALDVNEAPRLERRDNFDYLYLRIPSAHNARDAVQATKPILAVYDHHVLIVVSGSKIIPTISTPVLFSDLANMPTTIASLIYILARIIDAFDWHIKAQTDAIHDVVVKMQANKLASTDFISFIRIADQINSFTSALAPLDPLFNRLQSDKGLNLTGPATDMLIDAQLAAQQSISVCDANAKRIASIRDAYATLSNDSLNKIMKTLTIATLLLAAPNLIFSMYGMNVKLPLQHSDVSFLATLALAVIVVILFIIWGKKRRLF